jgi:hypothetical protein
MSTYQERFEQNFLSLSHDYALDNQGGAKGSWCTSRVNARADFMATNLLYYWGLADGGQPKFAFRCAKVGNLYGLFGIKTRYYYAKGYPLSIFDTRELGDVCEKLESLELYALNMQESANLRLTTMGTFGGSAAKNAKIDRRKWEVIADFATNAKNASDGVNYDTCAEEGLASVYDAAAAALEKDLNKMDKPLDPTILFALIGGGVLTSILLINKAVR